ncbi:MAG: septal ring lytic transglycosylase RlpA family protein, partial [Sedimenticola sp.]
MIKGKLLFTLPACALLVVAACSIRPPSFPGSSDNDSAPTRRLDPNSIADAVPRAERRSRRGNADSYVVLGKRYHVMANSDGFSQRGIASWYGTKFHGRTTSSGEVYDMYAMTAAHKSLPLPTYVEVTNLNNGRHTIVKVNDRGPFHNNRIIDLSYAAATKLG